MFIPIRKNDRLEWTGDYSCKTLMSSVYEEMKNSAVVPLTMDLSVMEQMYFQKDKDPLETNTTMLKEQMASRNVRCILNNRIRGVKTFTLYFSVFL